MKHFETANDLQDWLISKPRGWSGILGARAALRVLPHLHFLIPVSHDRARTSTESMNYLIPLFRCHMVGTIAGTVKEPTLLAEVAEAAKLASDMAKKAKTSPFYNALADSIRVPFAPRHEDAARFASQAYFHASSAGLEAAQSALAQDIHILEESAPETGERSLLLSPLWAAEPMPGWEAKSWTTFADKLRKIGNDWHIWADWYGGGERDGVVFPGVLHGAREGHYIFNLKVEDALQLHINIAKIRASRWDVAPWKINGEIRTMIEGMVLAPPAQEEEPVVKREPPPEKPDMPPASPPPSGPVAPPPPPHPAEATEEAIPPVEPAAAPQAAHGVQDLHTLIIRQKVLISAILSGLSPQVTASLKVGLNEYLGELNTRGAAAIAGVLDDLHAIIVVGSEATMRDGLLEPATSEAFARFGANHAMIVRLIADGITGHATQP